MMKKYLLGFVGCKVGMSCVFIEDGQVILVILIEVILNCIVQIKIVEFDGYSVVQVIVGVCCVVLVNKLEVGYFVKVKVEVGCGLWEFCVEDVQFGEFVVGGEVKVDIFEVGQKVDVQGVIKGKGFQGIIKCYNFCMGDVIYGNLLLYCVLGFLGQCQILGCVFLGKKMFGYMGLVQQSIQNLEVVKVDVECGLIVICGVVLGVVGGDVIVCLVSKV